jgi:hypothetical protein
MADDMGLLAAGVAVVVALVALVGRGAGETVLRPVGGDGADPSGGGTPDDPVDVGTGDPDGPDDPDGGDWQFEDSSDRPENDGFQFDFGGDPHEDGGVWVGDDAGSVVSAAPDTPTQPWRS